MTSTDWHRVTASLSYRLGEIGLFLVRFEGLSYRRHFSTLQPFAQVPEPPVDATERFVFYPTYPVSFTPSPIVRLGHWIAYTPYTFRNYYVDLKRTGSFEAYLRAFSPKSRSTLQRKVRKFANASGGDLRWKNYRTAADFEEFFDHARTLSAKTYQERLLASGLPSDDPFRARAVELAASGGARGFILFMHARPVAYIFAFCRHRVMTYDYVGYDPDVQSLSPGTVLQYLMLEALFEEGEVDIFDFTEGEGQHKAFFSTDDRLCAKTYFFRRSLRNAAVAYSHYGLNRTVGSIGEVLDRLGLKALIRKAVRRAA